MNSGNAASRQIPTSQAVPLLPEPNPQIPSAAPFCLERPPDQESSTAKSRVVNYVVLEGYLGQDPDQKQTPSGVALVHFSLATQESYKDNAGQWQKKTQWHRIVAWAQVAQLVASSLRKGAHVRIEGRLSTRYWTDQQDHRRTEIQVVAKELRFLGRGTSQSKTRDPNSSFTSFPTGTMPLPGEP